MWIPRPVLDDCLLIVDPLFESHKESFMQCDGMHAVRGASKPLSNTCMELRINSIYDLPQTS